MLSRYPRAGSDKPTRLTSQSVQGQFYPRPAYSGTHGTAVPQMHHTIYAVRSAATTCAVHLERPLAGTRPEWGMAFRWHGPSPSPLPETDTYPVLSTFSASAYCHAAVATGMLLPRKPVRLLLLLHTHAAKSNTYCATPRSPTHDTLRPHQPAPPGAPGSTCLRPTNTTVYVVHAVSKPPVCRNDLRLRPPARRPRRRWPPAHRRNLLTLLAYPQCVITPYARMAGGPGFEGPRPSEPSAWIKAALSSHRVLLLDQRGTGRSAPITTANLARRGAPQQQAEYLSLFRWARVGGVA